MFLYKLQVNLYVTQVGKKKQGRRGTNDVKRAAFFTF